MFSLENEQDISATSVTAEGTGLTIRLKDGQQFQVPYAGWPSLAAATPQQRVNFRLIGAGEGIHWPDIDEDLSIRGLYRDFAPKPKSPIEEVPHLIAELYKVTRRLGQLFNGRPFTPDGHLVGSIGEVVAEYIYDLELEECSTPQFDARMKSGKETVQIKLTGDRGKSYGFRWSSSLKTGGPDLLICLKLTQSGFEEVYAGRFPTELLTDRNDSSNGQLAISISELKAINPGSIPHLRSLSTFNLLFQSELESAA